MRTSRLICFAHSGGTAQFYRKWKQWLDPALEIIPVDYPGRVSRLESQPATTMKELVMDCYDFIKAEITDNSYFLGHSLGGLVAYEIAAELAANGQMGPRSIFLTGAKAPHVATFNEDQIHLLPDSEFAKELISLGGLDDEFINNDQLMEYFLPMVRADMTLLDAYDREEISVLNCPIYAFFGKEEKVTAIECHAWSQYTLDLCTITYYPGGHFFINDQAEKICEVINSQVKTLHYII